MKLKLAIGLFALSPSLFAETTTTEDDRAALKIGRAAFAVDRALNYKLPEVPSPTEVAKANELAQEVIRAGREDSLYVWVKARVYSEIGMTKALMLERENDEVRARELNAHLKYLLLVKAAMDAPK